jgi:phenylalanyl-tRNA synthetase alpha chain
MINHTELKSQVLNEIKDLKTESELTEVWRKYLGKDGIITNEFKEIGSVAPEERKDFGLRLNELKNEVDILIENAKAALQDQNLGVYLEAVQGVLLNDKPKIGHIHPLTQTINDMNKILMRIGYSVMDGPEIETAEYNFERANLPIDHPAMDLQDSIYIEEPNILLRTQTTSIETHILEQYEPPFKVVMPGRTYRNEKVTRTNHFVFHQYQLVCIQEKVSMADLLATIEYLFKSYLGDDVVIRFRNKYYPEVEPGVGPDMQCFNCHGAGCAVCKNRGWIEMGGAGIRHPNMLKMAGIDPEKWQGFAFGLGLDRWAMAKHKITDIRTLLGGNLAYKPNVN